MRNLSWEGKYSQAEKNLAILLGTSLPIYVNQGDDTEWGILARVRKEVLKNYSKSERQEISQFASIHPSGASLLSTSRTLAEFRDRLYVLYSEVRSGEVRFECRIPPTTWEWNWSTKRNFDWTEGKESLSERFPKAAVSMAYPEWSLLTWSLYVSK